MARIFTLTPHTADVDTERRLRPGLAPFRSRLIRGIKREDTTTIPMSGARLIIAAAVPEAPRAPRVRRFRRD